MGFFGWLGLFCVELLVSVVERGTLSGIIEYNSYIELENRVNWMSLNVFISISGYRVLSV